MKTFEVEYDYLGCDNSFEVTAKNRDEAIEKAKEKMGSMIVLYDSITVTEKPYIMSKEQTPKPKKPKCICKELIKTKSIGWCPACKADYI